MRHPRDSQIERVDTGCKNMADGPDLDTPNYWYSDAWYHGIAAAGFFFVVAAGIIALGAWLEMNWILGVGGSLGFIGFIAFFGGIASLLRQSMGELALKRLIVAAVILIVLACPLVVLWAGGAFRTR
jgi:hypothetical protein